MADEEAVAWGSKEVLDLKEIWSPTSKIKAYNLSSCGMESRHCRLLASAFSVNKTAERIVLNDNRLEDEGAAAFEACLFTNTHLKALLVGQCGITHIGTASMIKGISSTSALRVLDVSFNQIGDLGAASIASRLIDMPNLNELYLVSCRITDSEAAVFGQAASLGSRLELLDLSCNRVGECGLPALLSSTTPIRSLILQQCEISDRAVRAVVTRAISPHLRLLDLSGNEVGSAGCSFLSDCVHLEVLALTQCGITGDDILACNFPPDQALLLLSLSDNDLGDAAFLHLIQQTRLKTLAVVRCGITDEWLRDDSAVTLGSITALSLESNALGDRGACRLARSCPPILSWSDWT